MEEIIGHSPTQNQNSVYGSFSTPRVVPESLRSESELYQSSEYPKPLKNLDKLACTKAFAQTPSRVFTAIHPINTTGLFNYRVTGECVLFVYTIFISIIRAS